MNSHGQTAEPLWEPHARVQRPERDKVQVWCARLDRTDSDIQSYRRLLSEDERERADRFHFDKDRNHFTVARAILRTILGACLGAEPRALRFSYTYYGKPSLEQGGGDPPLRFNVSHSRGMALFAVTSGRELGVDIEFIRRDIEYRQIAERFFSPREVAVLCSLPDSLQAEGFFNCWTRKEAYIKARGEGLSLPLDRFDVTLRPGEPARLVQALDDAEEASRWELVSLAPCDGYAAAIAVEGRGWELECRRWPDELTT